MYVCMYVCTSHK
jgi:hypothetical protein